MEKIKALMIGAIVISAVIFGIAKTEWSVMNLIFGPQYESKSKSEGNPRAHFVSSVVPEMYPELIRCIQDEPEKVQWRVQTGEMQSAIISLTEKNSVLIETTVYVGTQEELGNASSHAIAIEMLDYSQDGKLDTITYIQPDGKTHDVTAPFDEASQYLWDSVLAMEFREGACFK